MKVCENCGIEHDGRDGETLCPKCDNCESDAALKRRRTSRRAGLNRRAREQCLRDCGLVKVRGALGGVYWE